MIKFKAPSKGRYRRGLRPLRKRLNATQLLVRIDKIALRAETKALAKIVQRKAARKGTAK